MTFDKRSPALKQAVEGYSQEALLYIREEYDSELCGPKFGEYSAETVTSLSQYRSIAHIMNGMLMKTSIKQLNKLWSEVGMEVQKVHKQDD